jgi:Tfp pilus assembly protein PilO
MVVSLLAALGLFFGFVAPKYQLLKSKTAEVEAKKVNLENTNNYYKRVTALSEQLKTYKEELAKIDSAIPSEVSLPQLYDFFINRASESGLVLKNESASGLTVSKTMPGLKELRFGLELTGSYENFKNFLKVLEKSARMIEIEKISFSSSGKSNDLPSFSLSVKFYSY